jgi:hypothetical protein
MLPALASVSELEARLGLDPNALTGADKSRAQAALDDVSTLVRFESRKDWVDKITGKLVTVPIVLGRITLGAALRAWRNPEGLTTETAGPFTRTIKDTEIGSLLTEPEKVIIRRFRPVINQLWTQPTTRQENADSTLFLEDQFGAELFPIGYIDEWWR